MEVLGTGGAEEGLPPLGIWEFTSVFDHHDNGDLMDGAKDILPCTGQTTHIEELSHFTLHFQMPRWISSWVKNPV